MVLSLLNVSYRANNASKTGRFEMSCRLFHRCNQMEKVSQLCDLAGKRQNENNLKDVCKRVDFNNVASYTSFIGLQVHQTYTTV